LIFTVVEIDFYISGKLLINSNRFMTSSEFTQVLPCPDFYHEEFFQNHNVYMESIHLQADALKGLLIVPICVIATFIEWCLSLNSLHRCLWTSKIGWCN